MRAVSPDDFIAAVEHRQEESLPHLFPRYITDPEPETPAHKEEKTVNGPIKPWTDADDLTLAKNSHLGKEAVAKLLDRSVSSVKNRAVQKGVSLKKRQPGEPAGKCWERAADHYMQAAHDAAQEAIEEAR